MKRTDLRTGAVTRGELVESLDGRRLVVCVGPGGVGKTTLAAALGLLAAEAGRRVLVLTVDPAKRLADALGLDGIDDREREVALSEKAAGGGTLHVAMLDTKKSYDALIGRIADVEAAARIRGNAVYAAFSKTLAKSHAYIAAERLYDVMSNDAYDLVVLDTPPTRSALEILDAPRTLARFVDADILKYFLRPEGKGSPLLAIARAGGRAALSLLSSIAGEGIASELLGFIEVLASHRAGFAERAAENERVLAAHDTLYCLVAAAEHGALADAAFLAKQLEAKHRAAELLLVNQVFPVEFAEADAAEGDAQLVRHREDEARRVEARVTLARPLCAHSAGAAMALPSFAADIQDVEGLRRVFAVSFDLVSPSSSET